jgi:hypothetical protein
MYHKLNNFVELWRPAGLDLRAPLRVTVRLCISCTSCPAGRDLRASNYVYFRLRNLDASALAMCYALTAPNHPSSVMSSSIND